MPVGAEGQAREMRADADPTTAPRGHAHARETKRRGPPREVGADVRAGV